MDDTTLRQRRSIFAEKFTACQKILSAVGDETRQLIIKLLIEHCGEGGLRVGEIQKSTNISRTAVSHHLKILMDAGIIMVRKEGTRNFYYLESHSSSLKLIIEFWAEAQQMMANCPIRKNEEEQL